MSIKSLRDWLDVLKGDGLIKTVSREVNLKYEIAGLGKKADGKYALLFNNVAGAGIPVVTGLAGTRAMFAKAVGVPTEKLVEAVSAAQASPCDFAIIDKSQAPVKEVVELSVDLGKLPIPVHHEKDGGPYITAGVLISKDPETGAGNLSIHRLHVLGPNRLGILILPRHLSHFYRKAEAQGKPLDVAIAIGVDPILLLASQAIAPLGFDEYTIASALYDRPLELVPGETVDLAVPAHAEIVLEGRLLPDVREIEGPFGEYPKYYGPASPKPVIELTAITTRRNPIFHTIVPATMEHMLLGAIPREGGMLQVIKGAVPNALAVHLTPGGTCRYHAVIAIDKQNEGEAKNAMFAAFASSQEVKRVVVVDKDVDIFDPVDVEWAIATRFQAGRDLVVVSDALGNKLDPSSNDGLSDKLGIDATVPCGSDPFRFEKIRIPGEKDLNLDAYIDKP
ncbi:UbiD family decarboxylase [Anaeroselena agilis]|uniref:UbiD family decarboxylase n=1 Tax=Anaeroselena agilis TaxID=3063788 RepID=A0ABU3P2W3_9FIRM|nr:UbiD family decarboxylase [Selenomonadales bacterium 4137-cl]